MLTIFDYKDHLEYIKAAIDAKKSNKNRPPSLRNLAGKIDISVAYLSKVLNKKQALSTDAALKISEWLDLSPVESEYLLLLLKFSQEKNETKKNKIHEKISSYAQSQSRKEIEPSLFEKIASKNHITTLLLMAGKYKSIEAIELSKILDLDIKSSVEILETLEKCQLVKKVMNKYQRIDNASLIFQSHIPNHSLRSVYKEMLNVSIDAIDNAPMEDRIIGNEIFLIDKEQLPKLRQIIDECFTKVITLSNQSKSKDSAYSLGIQLVKLTKSKL